MSVMTICFASFLTVALLTVESKLSILTYEDPLAGQVVKVEPFGSDSLRIRASPNGQFQDDLPGALLPQPLSRSPVSCVRQSSVSNGNIQADVLSDGRLSVKQVSTGTILLEETKPRQFSASQSNGFYALTAWFRVQKGERLYGFGQHKTGALNNVGQKFQMRQENTEVFIPLVHSTFNYSYLWNTPSFGEVTVGDNETEWTSDAAVQMDVWVTTTPAPLQALRSRYSDCLTPTELASTEKIERPIADDYDIPNNSWTQRMKNYVDATGYPTLYPFFTTGFWQSRNRYRSQQEFLNVSYGYAELQIPVSVIVIDYYSWKVLGDEILDPNCWPNPEEMNREVLDLGMRIMVSPYFQFVTKSSVNFPKADASKALVVGSDGQPVAGGVSNGYMYDVFDNDSRTLMFDNALQHYFFEDGIQVWWLDCAEPCGNYPDGSIFYNQGKYPDRLVGSMFPTMLIKAVWEGMVRVNLSNEVVMLSRSAWAGAHRFGGAVWSGDIDSTFQSLSQQVRAGLNIAMSGIYYWTTDIGGYHGGDLADPQFEELIVRWFQFGAFCPLFRLHGCRKNHALPPNDCGSTCGANEIWAYSDTAQYGIQKMIRLRESLREYTYVQYQTAAKTGVPVMRPLFFDFPEDTSAIEVEDEFMFGPDWLVAPILEYKATNRSVYLPKLPTTQQWRHHFTGMNYSSGSNFVINGPLDEFPLFQRVDKGMTKGGSMGQSAGPGFPLQADGSKTAS